MKKTLLVSLMLAVSLSGYAQESGEVNYPEGWQLTSIKVLKDLDTQGAQGLEIVTPEGGCLISGQRLTAGMDTSRWILGTSTEAYTANNGPWDVAVDATLPGFNANGTDSWFSIHCMNRKHSVRVQQFKETVAEFLELEFKYKK